MKKGTDGNPVVGFDFGSSFVGFQVGLLGMARTLQQDLDRIAAQADTTTASGLHYVLTGQWYLLVFIEPFH